MFVLRVVTMLAILVAVPAWAGQADASQEKQRESFREARSALERGDLAEFERVSTALQDYVLYPYLRYAFLQRHLDSRVSHQDVIDFLDQWGDTPLANRLRNAWLNRLAEQGRWAAYRRFFRPDGNSRRACYQARALLERGEKVEAMRMAERLWLVGTSQSKACDPLFSVWIEEGNATPERAWERIRLAIGAGNPALTRYLEQFIPVEERPLVEHWRRLYSHPQRELDRLRPGDEWSTPLFVSGIRQLVRRDIEAADRVWRQRADDFPLSEENRAGTARYIALALAWKRHPDAAARLKALPVAWHNAESRAWRVRTALWGEDWSAVLVALDALEPEQRERAVWRYWRARALAMLDRGEQADSIFSELAQERSYYGFLAAERTDVFPRIETVPLAVTAEQLESFASRPDMQRIRELLALSMTLEARREWWAASRGLSDEAVVAAKLADTWGWHDQAIITLGRARFFDDLEIRFPTPYETRIDAEARRRELDTAFVYAVMRQESAFFPHARSSAGALGLMQLMPGTARMTARRLQQPKPGKWDLLTEETNIRLGTAHLRHLLDRYSGNRLYTMAAYNAGPKRVEAWLPQESIIPGDIWVECLPFDETRTYVKRIFAYTTIYEWRLGRELTPLSAHMPMLGSGLSQSVFRDPDSRREGAGPS
ncbi:transglycosylase SLT domain-containing protein [Thiohalomonas denitrificans]|uniref:Soluble lytic murein transglycosylase n=1 Tax=Thiohalomonas denitrificans TaxID=415747 RepID=A0A1G5PR94_9GAMM|nr:transglycosylase SLT domain-containing protein [Thiohalomonas denitrificans]SCZ51866.1 soluble lytic murein transglycosylase [Thiohalomonas denitrificans]